MSVLLSAAQRLAAEGKVPSIFLDGRTFSRDSHLEEVVRAAAEADVDYRILHLSCPDELALQCIREAYDEHVAGNRDADLYWEVKAHFEPIHGENHFGIQA